jgi:DNA-binding MarR family transcriptional regulator
LLKGLLVLARTVEEVLEVRAVRAGIGQPMGRSNVQVLRLLDHRGGHTASQVARFLGVSKPRVSQMIDAMARDGVVVRRRTEGDQREVWLELTKRGRLRAQAVQREQRHRLRMALRLVRQPGVARWADTLHEIAGALARADRVCEQFCLQCGAHADATCVLTGGDAKCLYLRHMPSPSRGPAPKSRKSRSRKPVS